MSVNHEQEKFQTETTKKPTIIYVTALTDGYQTFSEKYFSTQEKQEIDLKKRELREKDYLKIIHWKAELDKEEQKP